jgi:hypothetical protein
MTEKEIEVLAAKNAPLPDGLDVPERYLFLCLRSLYAQFRAGTVDRQQAKREKTEIVSGYESFRLRWKITQQDMRILREVQLTGDYYRKDGCPKCRELYDRLCGVERSRQ